MSAVSFQTVDKVQANAWTFLLRLSTSERYFRSFIKKKVLFINDKVTWQFLFTWYNYCKEGAAHDD